jgi:hypothetical protein
MTLPTGKFWTYATLLGVVADGLFLAIAIPSYLASRDERVRMDATIKAQTDVIAKLDDQMKQRDRQAAADIQRIRDEALQVRTPAQAVAALPKVIELPKPIFLQPAEVVPGPGVSVAQIPDAPSAVIPSEDIMPLFMKLSQCKADQVALGVCRADVTDLKAKGEALEQQRDAALRATRGTFWQKFKGCAVRAGVGAAGGGFSGSRNAAIGGATLGVASCFFIK